MGQASIWWVLWENRPVQGSKQGCTYPIMVEMLSLKDGWFSGYFDTKYMTVLRMEQILHNFEKQKIANFFNLAQVNFRVTLVICVWNKIWNMELLYTIKNK